MQWSSTPPMRTATESNGGRSNGPTNVNFGRLVAVRRSALGLSQERLAARMHTSPSAVARIEEGHPPSHEVMQALTAALHGERAPGALRRSIARPAAGLKAVRRRAAVGLAIVIVTALWLFVIAVDEHGAGIGFAIAAAATLFLSVFVAARGAKTRAPAAIVVALWLSVIAVGLISNAGGPGLSDLGDDGTEAVLPAPGGEVQAQDGPAGAALGLVASGDGGSREAGSNAPGATSLPASGQVGRCASRGRRGERTKFLVIGISRFSWTGGLVVNYYPKQACGPEPLIKSMALRASSRSRGGSPGSGSAGSQGNSLVDQGGSSGGNESAGNTGSTQPVSGAGNALSGAGNTSAQPVSGAGNAVNTVTDTVRAPVNTAGGVLKGLGG